MMMVMRMSQLSTCRSICSCSWIARIGIMWSKC